MLTGYWVSGALIKCNLQPRFHQFRLKNLVYCTLSPCGVHNLTWLVVSGESVKVTAGTATVWLDVPSSERSMSFDCRGYQCFLGCHTVTCGIIGFL